MNSILKKTSLLFLFCLIGISSRAADENIGLDFRNTIFEKYECYQGDEPYKFLNFSFFIREGNDKQVWEDDQFVVMQNEKEVFTCDFSKIQGFKVANDRQNKEVRYSKEQYLYLDTTVIVFKLFTFAKKEAGDPAYRLIVSAYTQKNHHDLYGYAYGGKSFYISTFQPLYLSPYTFTLKMISKPESDAKERLVIECEHAVTKEKTVIPIVRETNATIGRFSFQTSDDQYSLLTKTLSLDIQIEKDRSIKGAKAAIDNSIKGKTVELPAYIDSMGTQYGFDVEWGEYPGYSESIELLKSLNDTYMCDFPDQTSVEKAILSFAAFMEKIDPLLAVGYEWKDDTHLRIWLKNYPQFLEKRKKEDALVLEKKKEEEKTQALRDKFIEDNKVEIRVIDIKGIQSSTIIGLISNEIKNYTLYDRFPDVEDDAKRFLISSDYTGAGTVIAHVTEAAVADERTNILVVSVLPQTFDKIAAIVDRLTHLENRTESIPVICKTQITLLEGWKKGDIKQLSSGLPTETTEEKEQKSRDLSKGKRAELKQEDILVDGKHLVSPQAYGIDPKDVDLFGFDLVAELSKLNVNLVAEHGEAGKLAAALGDKYHVKLEFLDSRPPYILVKCGLFAKSDDGMDKPLIENTLFLENEKPALLGLTNLKQALILLVKIQNRK